MMVNMKLGKGWLDKFIKRNAFQQDYVNRVIKKLQAEDDEEQLYISAYSEKLSEKRGQNVLINQS